MENFSFKKLTATTIAVIVGLLIGVGIALIPGGWDFIEPITGITTLAVAGAAWYEAKKSSNVMKKKMFEISFGLRKGYAENAETSSVDDAIDLVKKWIQHRLDAGLPLLTGFIDDKTLVYPVRKGQVDGNFHPTAEPGAVFAGSLSPKYDAERTDQEVKETLNDLARFLGKGLEQERVYLSFLDKQWVVDLK